MLEKTPLNLERGQNANSWGRNAVEEEQARRATMKAVVIILGLVGIVAVIGLSLNNNKNPMSATVPRMNEVATADPNAKCKLVTGKVYAGIPLAKSYMQGMDPDGCEFMCLRDPRCCCFSRFSEGGYNFCSMFDSANCSNSMATQTPPGTVPGRATSGLCCLHAPPPAPAPCPSTNTTCQTCLDYKNETECTDPCQWNPEVNSCGCVGSAPKDVVFVVDGSSSISTVEFDTQRSIVKDVMTGIIPIGSRMGVVQFSHRVVAESLLTQYQNLASILQTVDGMTQLTGNTHIGDAINMAVGQSFLGSQGITNESWIILVTDGNNNGGIFPCSLTQAIQDISGLHVLVIGVTPDFDPNGADINCLVANEAVPSNNILYMPTFSLSAFDNVVPYINQLVCVGQ